MSSGAIRRSVVIDTLGCKVNLFESEYLYDQLQTLQWDRSKNDQGDLCIINTCTVTKEADRQSRQAVRRAIRRNPNAKIIVTGCYAEMQPEKCAEIPGVDLVVPGTRKLEIPRLASNDASHSNSRVLESKVGSSELPQEPVVAFESRSRAFLQVQQGCDNGCTFCIIHQARGPSRSILPTTINRQVEQYVQQGFHEIVICGIDLGSYGGDLSNGTQPAFNLASLTRELATRYPETRFRWSSIDPAHITPDIVGVLEEHENVCPHIHLSLQSASPIILKRMKRRYTPEEAYQAIKNLRRVRSDLVLSADIMAGFPTESDADFELTRTALYDLEIAYPHVFAYSEREGTPAARIPKYVAVEVRTSRAKKLRLAGAKIREQVLNRYIGKQVDVLIEGFADQQANVIRSRMSNYLPVYFTDITGGQRGFKNIVVAGLYRDGLWGVEDLSDKSSHCCPRQITEIPDGQTPQRSFGSNR